jgi:hypothetical protein
VNAKPLCSRAAELGFVVVVFAINFFGFFVEVDTTQL